MKLVLLHPDDNILIVTAALAPGDTVEIEGQNVTIGKAVDIGHKLARRPLQAGDKVYRYGAPIGSMTQAAQTGEHVHLHNMKSDYIPTHSRDTVEQRNA
ncbi:UxaA family hydrolase [Stakelama pacifica]|uniref:SAF domain-containing protein n=1 Tax=Stakelama pacifica TaxID=517720 RepID=A0A4R6FG12_9SPHN|nr:UxaA family hydrolase [Stakelama pacifica]MAX00053.1 altronate hydrolase [Sphingomonas sp.]TDN80232.1 SAF domain-containing protein [Stakelama pacifica]GGO97719.1 hydrolase [Stakelama pacifica]